MIPVEAWGRDHLSTLLYVETVCVDHHSGLIDCRKMRGRDYPCKLRSSEIEQYSDFDCLEDLRSAGLVLGGERNTFREHRHEDGPDPKRAPRKAVSLTPLGWKVAGFLRQWRAEQRGGLPPVENLIELVGVSKENT